MYKPLCPFRGNFYFTQRHYPFDLRDFPYAILFLFDLPLSLSSVSFFLFVLKILSAPFRTLSREQSSSNHRLSVYPTFDMASQVSSPVCSLPAYQMFMPLSGFPPALGYCSTTALLNKRTNHITASSQRPPDFQCPTIDTSLCDLLSQLKASDHEFARGVWYVYLTNPENKHSSTS